MAGLVIVAILVFIVVGAVGTFAIFGCTSASLRMAIVIAAMIATGITGVNAWYNWATTYRDDRIETCTVTDKDRGGKDGSYRVYTEECGVLANRDSWLRWKRNSADLWQEIPEQGVCEFQTAGSRWPHWQSQMRNIFDVVSCTPA